jgi:hypothetical protein
LLVSSVPLSLTKAVGLPQAIAFARDPLAGMRDIGNGSRAFVDNGRNAEATPTGELIGDKVSG